MILEIDLVRNSNGDEFPIRQQISCESNDGILKWRPGHHFRFDLVTVFVGEIYELLCIFKSHRPSGLEIQRIDN